jgi:hypothetical protein
MSGSGFVGSYAPARRDDRMDAAYYEDLAGQIYGLLIAVEDRLGVERAQEIHHLIEVGEYELALEETAGGLGLAHTAITDQERADMLALARRMKMGELVPNALRSCPRAG